MESEETAVLFKDRFEYIDRTGKKLELLAIWQENSEDNDVGAEDEIGVEADDDKELAEKAHEIEQPEAGAANNLNLTIPLRLYDCTDGVLKDQETYLRETDNVAPSYLIVSQVWGDIQELMGIPSVGWKVPISDRRKWDIIMDYCRSQDVKWLWMDILCINQTKNSAESDREKALEIPKMSFYYREATACLVIPDRYETFPQEYKEILELHSMFKDTITFDPSTMLQVWNSIEKLRSIIQDAWFWRVWTLQELLLPQLLVLSDGQILDPDDIRSALDWYHIMLQRGILKKPTGGKDYPYIHPTGEIKIAALGHANLGDSLRKVLKQKGHIDLVQLVINTQLKRCTKAEDRLFALYGLVGDGEKVAVQVSSDSSHTVNSDTTKQVSVDLELLRLKWKETLWKVLRTGKIWPLLYDSVDPSNAMKEASWMPHIIVSDGSGQLVPDVLDYGNRHAINVSKEGLKLAARRVGRVIGASGQFGDGGGELNRVFLCLWILRAKGFDISPIVELLKNVLQNPVWERDSLPPSVLEVSQMALEASLYASSPQQCFQIYEAAKLRDKVVSAGGFCGWNRQIVCVELGGPKQPLACWAWIQSSMQPRDRNCWVFDVTSEPVDTVKQWLVAKRMEAGTYSKIGTARAHPVGLQDTPVRILLV